MKISRIMSSGRFRTVERTPRWSADLPKSAASSWRRRCNLSSVSLIWDFSSSICSNASVIWVSIALSSALVGAIDSWIMVLSSSVGGRLVLSNLCRTNLPGKWCSDFNTLANYWWLCDLLDNDVWSIFYRQDISVEENWRRIDRWKLNVEWQNVFV